MYVKERELERMWTKKKFLFLHSAKMRAKGRKNIEKVQKTRTIKKKERKKVLLKWRV